MVSPDDAIFCLVSAVLSDTNKRFLYDVGVYDSDDDQNVSLLFVDSYLFAGFNLTCPCLPSFCESEVMFTGLAPVQ